jgi:UDP-glucuronate 4-epimerase
MGTRGEILVTGCAGFIGSTLVDTLLTRGQRVSGIDSFEPFYARAVKERNLARASASPLFTFHEVDTRDDKRLQSVVLGARPSAIVDLAARAGVRDSLVQQQLYIDINVRGLQNVLSVAGEVGAPLVFASSSSVYGDSTLAPFREDRLVPWPASPYGATKLAGEALVAAHHAVTGLPVRVARLFTVYGPRQRPDLAVHKFAKAIVNGDPLPLYAGGKLIRDYTFVDDIVDGLVRMIESDADDLTVNLGGGQPHTTLDLVRQLEATFGAKAHVEELPHQPGDALGTSADITHAMETLGWAPKTSLPEGIEKFREWFLAERVIAQSQVSPAA